MGFIVEFYETASGNCPVRDFLDELKYDGRLAAKDEVMEKTNFDNYLEKQMQDPEFAARYSAAGEAWDVALQIAGLRRRSGLSQKELAKLLHTSQQQISRLESSTYEGHSLSMLRRVAHALHARVRVVFEPEEDVEGVRVAEGEQEYKGA